MNTDQTNSGTAVTNIKGAGRPRTVKRAIYLNPVDRKPRAKGRVPNGSKWIEVIIDRAIKASDYVDGTTKVYSEQEVIFNQASKGEKGNSINVTVIPSEQAAPAEAPAEQVANGTPVGTW